MQDILVYPDRLIHLASSLSALRYFLIPRSAMDIMSSNPGFSTVTRSEPCGDGVRNSFVPSVASIDCNASFGSRIPSELPIFRTLVSIIMWQYTL